MATIMTKQGNLDNVVTYEHICDTFEDIQSIDPHYITLGSTCVVINGESGGLEVYMANSNKEWESISITGGEGGGSSSLPIQILGSNDYDSVTGIPTIESPIENIIYLVPSNDDTNDMYKEWIYIDDNWEIFGSGGNIEIPEQLQADWGQTNTNSKDYIKNKPIISKIESLTQAQYDALTNEQKMDGTIRFITDANGETVITKQSIGLGNVDNTADADKPVSTLQRQAIDAVATKTAEITDSDVIITAVSNTRYVCGEVSTLDFTPSATGICDIKFTSGSSKTILTLPSTVKMPGWFEVEANTIYEISIADGIYGVVASWAV